MSGQKPKSKKPPVDREALKAALAECKSPLEIAEVYKRFGAKGGHIHTELTVDSLETYETALSRIEDGEHRSSLLRVVGARLGRFYRGMKPDQFRRIGEGLFAAAKDRKNTSMAKMQAIQSIIAPLKITVAELREAQKNGQLDPQMTRHLYALLSEFYTTFSEEDFEQLGHAVAEAAADPNIKSLPSRIKHVRMALSTVTDGLKIIRLAMDAMQAMGHQVVLDEQKAAVADAQTAAMLKKSRAKLRRPESERRKIKKAS